MCGGGGGEGGGASSCFLSCNLLKLKSGAFLTGYTVPMESCSVKKMTITSCFIPLLLPQRIQSGSIDPSNYKFWKVCANLSTGCCDSRSCLPLVMQNNHTWSYIETVDLMVRAPHL